MVISLEYLIHSQRKSGNESFIGLESTLLDYWRWAHSDIASNSERGKLAEYIVKCAVNAPSQCRVEWDAVDIVSAAGVKIEVKSSAYLQTWKCSKFSSIQFDIAPKRSWFSETNEYSDSICRNSDVYVFCLFASQDPATADPLNLTQWEFYIISTKVLNECIPNQKPITLNSLKKLGAQKANYESILDTINTILQQT